MPVQHKKNVKPFERFKKSSKEATDKLFKSTSEVVQKIAHAPKIAVKSFDAFVDKIDEKTDTKLIKILPSLLLSLTTIIIRNKSLIKPILKAFVKAYRSDSITLSGKLAYFLASYISHMRTLPIEDIVDDGFSIIILILEDIPNIINRLYNTTNYNEMYSVLFYTKIIKNIKEIIKDFKPGKEISLDIDTHTDEYKDLLKTIKLELEQKEENKEEANKPPTKYDALIKTLKKDMDIYKEKQDKLKTDLLLKVLKKDIDPYYEDNSRSDKRDKDRRNEGPSRRRDRSVDRHRSKKRDRSVDRHRSKKRDRSEDRHKSKKRDRSVDRHRSKKRDRSEDRRRDKGKGRRRSS